MCRLRKTHQSRGVNVGLKIILYGANNYHSIAAALIVRVTAAALIVRVTAAALTATATAADSSCTDCQSDSGRTDCLSYGSFGGGDLVTHGDVRLRDGRHRERDA